MSNVDAEKKNLYLKFPNLTELPEGSNSFFALFTNKMTNISYRIYLDVPDYPELTNLKIRLYEGIELLNTDFLYSEEHRHNSLVDILNTFQNMFIDNTMPSSTRTTAIASETQNLNVHLYIKKMDDLLTQIKSMKKDLYKIYASSEFGKIRIQDFINYENHFLELVTTANSDSSYDLCVSEHSLPDLYPIDVMFKPNGTIENYLTQFLRYMEDLEEFYCNMAVIDELCYVVDPQRITTKCITRTIKYDDKSYIKLIVDPLKPSSVNLSFIGQTNRVDELREKYIDRLSEWDSELDIYKNLLKIFEIMYFPTKKFNFNETNEKHCNICYTYRLNMEIPIVCCDNPKCDVVFHLVCLKDWFAQRTDCKTVYYITLGPCPFCNSKISTSFEQLLEDAK